MSAPSITVVIPYFNNMEGLRLSLKSVAAQSLLPSQVIIVDDGSVNPIASLDVGDRLKITLVRQSENQGPSAARNRGVRESNSDYIAFLDTGDEWLPEKLEHQIAFMSQEGLRFCATDSLITVRGKRTSHTFIQMLGIQKAGALPNLIGGNYITMNTVVLTRELATTFPFDEQLRYMEDYDVWLRIQLSGIPLGFLDEPLAIYHRDSASLSHNYQAMVEATVQVLQKNAGQVGIDQQAQLLQAIGANNIELCRVLLSQGNYTEAITLLRHFSPHGKRHSIIRWLGLLQPRLLKLCLPLLAPAPSSTDSLQHYNETLYGR